MNLLDKASMQQLLDLLTDEVLSLHVLSLWLLAHRLGDRVELQMVLNHLPRDPRHLRRLPSEHVGICLEEGDEREFLFPPRFPAMRVAWEGSAPTWMVFVGLPSAPDGCTFGALEGALALGTEEPLPPSSGRAISAVRVCTFSTAASAAVRSPCTVRIPAGDGILRTKYP
jgi:hypothetical protein